MKPEHAEQDRSDLVVSIHIHPEGRMKPVAAVQLSQGGNMFQSTSTPKGG